MSDAVASDDAETIANLVQRIGELERQVKALQRPCTDGGLNAISLQVALLIEDEYARHHPGGRTQRLAKTQLIAREALREALTGERDWRAWRPSGFTAPPEKPVD